MFPVAKKNIEILTEASSVDQQMEGAGSGQLGLIIALGTVQISNIFLKYKIFI